MSDPLTEARAAVTAEQARRDAPKCPETFTHPHTLRVYTCNFPLGHTIDHHDFGPAFPWTVNLRHAETLLAEVNRLTRERDAYKRAKAENDERYMIERDKARREVDRLTARVAELEQARAGDVARIAGWLRDRASEMHGAASEHAPGLWTAGAAMTTAADAIERGDWRDQSSRPHSDHVAELRGIRRAVEVNGSTPYQLLDVLRILCDVADHTLDTHSCDHHGYEVWSEVRHAGRECIRELTRLAAEGGPLEAPLGLGDAPLPLDPRDARIAALESASRAVLSLTGDEPLEEADAAWTALATTAGVPDAR